MQRTSQLHSSAENLTVWCGRDFMSCPGYFVYFLPERIGEIHALHPALKPDRQFLATHLNFVEVKAFPIATVYRYTPPH